MKIRSTRRRSQNRSLSFHSRRRSLEALEPRLLLSLSAGGFPMPDFGGRLPRPPEGTPPVAELAIDDVTAGSEEAHQFTVTYTDRDGVDYSDLDDRDVMVSGLRFSAPATFVEAAPAEDAQQIVATYAIQAPGGSWDAADNGPYVVYMRPFQVSDTEGTFVRSGPLGRFAVDIAPGRDNTPPEATLRAPELTRGGSSHYTFYVVYTDNVAVNVESIREAAVQVTGPDHFAQTATLVRMMGRGDGTPRVGVYRVAAPGETWDHADNGEYMVMLVGEVADTSGNTIATDGPLGTVVVNIGDPADTSPPEAVLNTSEPVVDGHETYSFTVTYTDDVAVDYSDLDDRDVMVAGRRFYARATFVEAARADDDRQIVATYQIRAPGGSWDADDNGTYRVQMRRGQISDVNHNFVAAGLLGSFEVELGDPADSTPPEAVLAAEELTTGGDETYTFEVTYTDDVAIDVSDLDGRDILVYSRRFSRRATLVRTTSDRDTNEVTATYAVDAPGRVWDAADNGTYRVIMRRGQVSDTSNNFVHPGTLGTFEVHIQRPTDRPTLDSATRAGRSPVAHAARDYLFQVGAFG